MLLTSVFTVTIIHFFWTVSALGPATQNYGEMPPVSRPCVEPWSLWCVRRTTVTARRSVHGHSTAVIVLFGAVHEAVGDRKDLPVSGWPTHGRTDGRSCRKTRARAPPAHRTTTRRINLTKHRRQRLCDALVSSSNFGWDRLVLGKRNV